MDVYIARKIHLSHITEWLVLILLIFLPFSCSQKGQERYAFLLEKYNTAHDAQMQGNMEDAANGYRECVEQCSHEQYLHDDSVKLLLPRAMGQLMNVYQSQGDLNGCVAYFDSLKREVDAEPTKYNKVLCRQFKRDVYVFLAYSLSRTDDEERAVLTMDEAMKMPLSYPTPERLFRDDAYAAGVYYCVSSTQAKVFEYGKKALAEVRQCKQKSGVQWLVTMLGGMYHRTGKVDEAIRMYQEGYELAQMAQDTLGMSNAKKEMADYLLQWNLDSLANRFATEAVQLLGKVVNKNPMVETGVYVTKARILKAMHQKENALSYLKKARESANGLPYNSGASDIGVLMGSLLVTKTPPCYPGDYAQGMALLENASHDATYKIKATAFFELAKANLAAGKQDEGEAQLDSMYTILNGSSTPIVLEGAYEYALRYYLKSGNQARAAMYSQALEKQKEIADRSASIKNVINAVTQMEMGGKERSLNEQEDEMNRHKTTAIAVTCGLVFVVIGLIVLCFWIKHKDKRKHNNTTRELSKTMKKLKVAQRNQQRAEERLATIEDDNVKKIKDGQQVLAILRDKGEPKFREYFEQAYPAFIKQLRAQVPSITHKEESYCMLMALGMSNAELAEAFVITRQSVNIARCRIRKKLPEAEKTRMEAFLAELLKKED